MSARYPADHADHLVMWNHPAINSTIAWITELHAGQTDWAGRPYHFHPKTVMARLGPKAAIEDKHIALLHDVMEDCGVTEAVLQALGYSRYVIDGVKLVTRPTVEQQPDRPSYIDWIRSIAASGHTGAMRVKYADNSHNSDLERIATIADAEVRQRALEMAAQRYGRSMRILQDALADLGLLPACGRW